MRVSTRPVRLVCAALALAACVWAAPRAAAQARPCSFSGPAAEQARCLLRPVARYGVVGPARPSLPAPLDRLVGESVAPALTVEALRSYLAARGIREADLGGPLAGAVSRTSDGTPARYFIIHDTSTPTLPRAAAFPPAGMDAAAWPGNDFGPYLRPPVCPARRRDPRAVCDPVAHVFVNRAGQSVTGHDFARGWRSTQYEMQTPRRRGLFLAVENIQPRRRDARGIDAEAPVPGFADAQLDRLALVYAAASVRAGRWLIPAYHAVIDLGVGTHDDPQNFDLDRWAARLGALLGEVGAGGGAAGGGGGGALPEEAVRRLVTRYAARLAAARYMEQDCRPAERAGYEGLPLVRCDYAVRDRGGASKRATVLMLNPSAERLARWVVDACLRARGEAAPRHTDKLFEHVIGQSGGQFPVAGIVFEDILPADGVQEIYCFRDGVTVRVEGVRHRGTGAPTAAELESALGGRVTSSFRYARLQSTTREQYRANGGTVDVGTSADGERKLSWLDVTRDLYKAAWGGDHNELMVAWARANL